VGVTATEEEECGIGAITMRVHNHHHKAIIEVSNNRWTATCLAPSGRAKRHLAMEAMVVRGIVEIVSTAGLHLKDTDRVVVVVEAIEKGNAIVTGEQAGVVEEEEVVVETRRGKKKFGTESAKCATRSNPPLPLPLPLRSSSSSNNNNNINPNISFNRLCTAR